MARVFRDVKQIGEDALSRTAELTGLTPEEVKVVVSYYAEYRDEIDAWIGRVDEEADRMEAAWRRGQDLLRR